MRHRKAGRRLNRSASHRKAMLGNMAASLFRHEQIKTTLPKARELRRVAEPLITLAKTASVANRRAAFARLGEREIVGKLFDELGPHFADRPGGYLRILKCGHRTGDNAPMAYVQLVGREMIYAADQTATETEEEASEEVSEEAGEASDAPTKKKKTAKKTARK